MVRARIEENIAHKGLYYPWWVPVFVLTGQIVCLLLALAVRDALWPPAPIAASVVLVLGPALTQMATRRWMPGWLENVPIFLATGWLLLDPVSGTGGVVDAAPFLLTLLTAEVVARDGLWSGTATAVLSMAMIVAAALGPGLSAEPIHLLDVVLGYAIGSIMLWQTRALAAEREARASERQRATMAERERIAREIHDLVAHSLSVTLLHITGARHALRDVERDRPEVAEVDDALADAERVGRQAMEDIRRTVSTLQEVAEGRSGAAHPLPGGADIAGLVDQMERAGLAVEYAEVGEAGLLAQATGLGVYRIAQESLANIAKHAPSSTARMQLTVTPTWARLTVRNALNGTRRRDDTGSGLEGMRARAEQLGATLTAGPDGPDWLVDLRLRLWQRDGQLWCHRLARRVTS